MQTRLSSLTFIVHDILLLSILNIHRYLFIGIFSLLSAFYDELRKLGLIQDYFMSPCFAPLLRLYLDLSWCDEWGQEA